MADIKPVVDTVRARGFSVLRLVWRGLDTAGTIEPIVTSGQSAIAGSVQFKGDLGAGVSLQVSNDDVTYFDLKDVHDEFITATADAFFDFSTSAAFIRPALNGSVGSSAEVVLVLRG